MTADFIKDGTKLTVKFNGRLDSATSPEFGKKIQPKQEEATQIIFDCENLEYVSSAGLRIILATEKKMLEKKCELKLIHVNEHIMDIFEMTGFVNMLNIEA